MSRTRRLVAGETGTAPAGSPGMGAAGEYPPIIYTRVLMPPKMSWSGRGLALAVALACLALLLTAARLEPSPHGFGTHRQLGLQSCAFKIRTGLPCPSCGMTTSWAYFARGKLAASFYTQPMGTVLALLAAAAVWAGLYIAVSGRPVHRLLRFFPSSRWLMPFLCFGLLAWGWKIGLTLLGIDR